MEPLEIRSRNFRSLEDTGWIKLRPLTLLIGANGSGKTSVLAPLLLLKQTLDSRDQDLALMTVGDLFNAGSYEELIFRRETSRDLFFGLRHHGHKSKRGERIKAIGEHPPTELDLIFSYTKGSPAPTLKKHLIRDPYGRVLLSRTRTRSERYSLAGHLARGINKSLRRIISRTPPINFLFTIERIMRSLLDARARKEKDERMHILGQLQEVDRKYLAGVIFMAGWIQEILADISYLGPLRESPSRLYEISGEHPANVGIRGQYAPEVLFRRRDPQLLRLVNNWIEKFEFGFKIECESISHGAFAILLRRSSKTPPVNLADTGFGLSQVLPLIVESFYSKRGHTIVAEQPEIHLNPRLQALLADLFCEVVNRGKRVVVETHSEHLLLRVRRLIAEQKIQNDKVALYYTEKSGDKSSIREIRLEKTGHIEPDEWPRGFFEESLRESLGLAAAQTKVGSDAG